MIIKHRSRKYYISRQPTQAEAHSQLPAFHISPATPVGHEIDVEAMLARAQNLQPDLAIVMQSDLQCSMCSSTSSNHCTTCQSSSYCSKTCQKADWPVHKLICRAPILLHAYAEHPSYPSYDAVLFPEKEQRPRFITFTAKHPYSNVYSYGDDGYGYGQDKQPHPGVQILHSHPERTVTITGNVLRSRSRTDTKIELYYNDTHPAYGTGINQSIVAVTTGGMLRRWRGSVLAVKFQIPVCDPLRYADMNPVDFRDVVDLLCTFPVMDINDMTNIAAALSPNAEVPAVRINSPGDQALGRPKFEEIKIRADSVACSAPIASISQLIESPLRVTRCVAPYAPEYDNSTHDIANPAATYLNLGADPANGWGFVGFDWVDPAGSVIVVRENGVKLSPQHLEAMCHWCQFVLKPLFDDSLLMGLQPKNPIQKTEVLARITRKEFENFYVGYDAWKGGVDASWKKSQFPFC